MRFFKYLLLFTLVVNVFAEDEINLTFKETPLEEVVKFVTDISGVNLLMTDKLAGSVTYISKKPISKSELLPFLDNVLKSKGYAMIKDGLGGYQIISATQAKQRSEFANEAQAGMITKIIPIRYGKAADAVNKARLFASPYGNMVSDDKLNTLIVTDYPDNINDIQKIINKTDLLPDKAIERVELKSTQVEKLLPKITSIVQSLQDTFTIPVVVIKSETDNSILLSGDKKDVMRTAQIIREIDAGSEPKEASFEVVIVNNAKAEEIATLVQKVMTEFANKDAQSAADFANFKVSVAASKEMNALLVAGTKNQIDLTRKIIKELDIEKKQVYLKAQIYEISRSGLENFGIKWGLAGGFASGSTLFSSTVGLGGSSFVLPDIIASNIEIDKINKGVAIGATIDLLKQDGTVNTISEPSVLCVNNLESSIYVGKTQSILTSTATGQSSTDLTRNSYTRQDIGLTLKVKPQVASDRKVVLEITGTIEDLELSNQANTDRPTTTKREIKSSSVVKDGESVIVGGLLKDYESTSTVKVPLLGDIPILGYLFKSNSDTVDKVELVMIITPYIVDKSNELGELQDRLVRFESAKNDIAKKLRRELENYKNRKDIEDKLEIEAKEPKENS